MKTRTAERGRHSCRDGAAHASAPSGDNYETRSQGSDTPFKPSLRHWSVLLVVLCASLIGSVQSAHAGATEWMDIRIVDGFLLIETEVGGVAGLSIVDTGAEFTAINANFLASNGSNLKADRAATVAGVVSTERRNTYREVEATVLGAPVTFTRLLDLELGSPDIQLLLGVDFLDQYVFQFDYVNERLRLITRDSVNLKKMKNVDAKKDRGSGSLLVRVHLNDGDRAWFLMDTGSNGGLLIDRKLARKLDWIGTFPTEEGVTSGVVSSSKMERFRVPSIEVGPFEIENVLVSMPAPGESLQYFETETQTGTRMANRSDSAGILGYDVLKHFVVTVDYDRGHVHFYPGEKLPAD